MTIPASGGRGVDPEILLEDNHCLAVNKPAGLLSQGDATGEPSLVDWAEADLKARYDKPGNVYVGLVHRLDRPVSGVVLLAKTSKAAARLSAQFREGTVAKVYRAIVEGIVREEEGEWSDALRKDRGRNVVEVVAEGGLAASLAYRVVGRGSKRTLLELRPTTGRGHQLRVQLASRGFPILGDTKYGAKSIVEAADGGHRIALHARSLSFTHPTKAGALSVEAPDPADWPGGSIGS